MAGKRIKATKLAVGLPFNLGNLEFEPDEVEQKAAWELYVELATRITIQPLSPGEGRLRESLNSLHCIFPITRDILKQSGPSVAKGPASFGAIAIEVLNKGIRPFLTEWHPLLLAYEEKRPSKISASEYERDWKSAVELNAELVKLQEQIAIYLEALAKIAGVSTDIKK